MSYKDKIRVGITGGAGYTGGELIRLLINHPEVLLVSVHSRSNAGKLVSSVHQDMTGETDLHFSSDLSGDIDVLFLCLGHGESRRFLEENRIGETIKVIDLSQDFRLKGEAAIGERSFVYGLPELNSAAIQRSANIANPGCFATALQLGLLPLAKAGVLQEVYTTGITGSTGAGQSPAATSHFSWRANNISAYKTLQHQHIREIAQSLQQLSPEQVPEVHFVPWRGDFTRGIFISSTVSCDLTDREIKQLYRDYYREAVFTHVCDQMIDLKQVINTNKCLVYPEKAGKKLVIHSAIDNLLKGASGQALQNMNLLFGLDETTGLKLKANAF